MEEAKSKYENRVTLVFNPCGKLIGIEPDLVDPKNPPSKLPVKVEEAPPNMDVSNMDQELTVRMFFKAGSQTPCVVCHFGGCWVIC